MSRFSVSAGRQIAGRGLDRSHVEAAAMVDRTQGVGRTRRRTERPSASDCSVTLTRSDGMKTVLVLRFEADQMTGLRPFRSVRNGGTSYRSLHPTGWPGVTADTRRSRHEHWRSTSAGSTAAGKARQGRRGHPAKTRASARTAGRPCHGQPERVCQSSGKVTIRTDSRMRISTSIH